MTTWTAVSSDGGSWTADSGGTSATWTLLGSDTTAQNSSRFIQAGAFTDSSGVDFNYVISDINPWIVTSTDPITLTSTRNETL